MKRILIITYLLSITSLVFAQSVIIKDSANEPLLTINDEGTDQSSIGIPDAGTAFSGTADKLYNIGSSLYWGGDKIALTGSADGDWTIDANNMYSTVSGNVGIGTSSPSAKLEVVGDDGVLFTGTYGGGVIQNLGAGTRIHFYPKKAAFRAGYVDGTQWDDAHIGYSSTALGDNTTASGSWSTALGSSTTASGVGSTALGSSTTASGVASAVLGHNTTASGDYSTAMCYTTTASGVASTALGNNTTASGSSSTALGRSTEASGNYSTAIGREIKASGEYTVAIALNDQNGTDVTQSNTMAIMGGKIGIGTIVPQSKLHIASGYIQIPVRSGSAPPGNACDDPTEYGRMVVRSDTDECYICMTSGWVSK